MITGTGLAAVGFGLAASLSWGTSDFSGGVAAKRAPIVLVMVLSYAVGLVLLFGLALAWNEPFPDIVDIAWAAAAGIGGSIGLTAQYRALAVGRMGLAAPVAAVLGAALPVAFAAFTEGLPGAMRIAGFACGLLAVWLIARPSDLDDARSGLGLAVIAGLGFGVFFILLDRVNDDALFWPLIAARGASLTVMLMFVATNGSPRPLSRAAIPVIVMAGLLDVGGNTFFLLAVQSGRLDVASVVSSLYPAVTAVWAWLFLREYLTRLQTTGVIAALVAIVLIAV